MGIKWDHANEIDVTMPPLSLFVWRKWISFFDIPNRIIFPDATYEQVRYYKFL